MWDGSQYWEEDKGALLVFDSYKRREIPLHLQTVDRQALALPTQLS